MAPPKQPAKGPLSLDSALLTSYSEGFYGFGNWSAKIWFIGIEEAGGTHLTAVHQRLKVWEQNGKPDLEDAPLFYPATGNTRWHGETAMLQPTWTQLIRMLLAARGVTVTNRVILDYQRCQLGKRCGETCLVELLPLPSPSIREWRYPKWSNLRWLENRAQYYGHVLVPRAAILADRVNRWRPDVVIFYGTTFFRIWSYIARATWTQAIPQKLVQYSNGTTTFFVTMHPLDPVLGNGRNAYFQEIGSYFRSHHAKSFAAPDRKYTESRAHPVRTAAPFPTRLDWPSMIGNYLLNFGFLDLLVQDFLENELPPAEFDKIRSRSFQERVERMKKLVEQPGSSATRACEISRLFAELEHARVRRNHFAHGVLRFTLAEDQKSWLMTVTLPRDLSGTESPDPLHLTFDDLLDALKRLNNSIEEFERLFGENG